MHHTEHTMTVDSPTEIVWEVLADIEGYARLFPPTQEATLLESSDSHQIARLVVDVSGELQTWTTRRELFVDRKVITYRQLETAPLVGHMSGEWRILSFGEQTQLVLTHDFEVREPVGDKIAGRFSPAEAEQLLQAAVERNSHADLAAVRDEAHRLAGRAR